MDSYIIEFDGQILMIFGKERDEKIWRSKDEFFLLGLAAAFGLTAVFSSDLCIELRFKLLFIFFCF